MGTLPSEEDFLSGGAFVPLACSADVSADRLVGCSAGACVILAFVVVVFVAAMFGVGVADRSMLSSFSMMTLRLRMSIAV